MFYHFDKPLIDFLKSTTKPFNVLFACTRPLITELSDKLSPKHPNLPTIPPYPTMRLETICSIIPISCRRHPHWDFIHVAKGKLYYICLRCGSSDAPMLTTSTPIMMQSEATASISTHSCMSIFAPIKSSNTHTPVFR